MRFYNQQHPFYCGVDLHAKTLHLCVLDQAGEIVRHRGIQARPQDFLRTIEPYRKQLVVGAECMFAWYWLSDLCIAEEITFVLGHALYMRAIHGGKTKNDKIDSEKIARLLRGGTFPMSYVYPRQMRATRDLLRRRCFLVRRRGELLAHLNNTFSQYNVTPPPGKFSYAANRVDLTKCFDDDSVRRMVQTDVTLAADFDKELTSVELYLKRHAKIHDPDTFHRLKTVPGIGDILAMVLLYEIHDIRRFADVGDFVSYARLVRGSHESAGKAKGSPRKKIGNAHLKWAFSEVAALFLRGNPRARAYKTKLARNHGKAKAMTILAHKLARAAYYILRRKEVFDMDKFFAKVAA